MSGKKRFTLGQVIFVTAVVFLLASLVPSLLDAKSDISVFIGVIITVCVLYGVLKYGRQVLGWVGFDFKDEDEEGKISALVLPLLLCLLIMATVAFSGCGYTKVPAGYEGVKINTLGDEKGALTVVGVGRHFYSWKYEMELFPLFKQNYVWTADKQEGSPNDESITFQSKESLPFSADIGISYAVMKGSSAEIYRMYHKGIDEVTDVDMRNSVRDALNRLGSKRSVEEIYGEGKADFIEDVYKDVSEYWTPQGIKIHKIYLVGEMRPPAQVNQAISAKIQATQIAAQRRNEVAQAKAEADKKIENARGDAESKRISAEGEAKAIALVQKQLGKSPEYIDYLKARRWDGKLPQIVGSGAIPMINLEK